MSLKCTHQAKKNLTFHGHVKNITKSAYYYLKNKKTRKTGSCIHPDYYKYLILLPEFSATPRKWCLHPAGQKIGFKTFPLVHRTLENGFWMKNFSDLLEYT